MVHLSFIRGPEDKKTSSAHMQRTKNSGETASTWFRTRKTLNGFTLSLSYNKVNVFHPVLHIYCVIWASTNLPRQYRSRSTGFSILPVGLRGTWSKMIRQGRLYRGSS